MGVRLVPRGSEVKWKRKCRRMGELKFTIKNKSGSEVRVLSSWWWCVLAVVVVVVGYCSIHKPIIWFMFSTKLPCYPVGIAVSRKRVQIWMDDSSQETRLVLSQAQSGARFKGELYLKSDKTY